MSQTMQICDSCLSRPKHKNEKKNEKKTESGQWKKNFLAQGDLVRGSSKVSFVARGLPLPVFYCSQRADMEVFRKVFNALEIENNEILRLYFHEYRKNLESVVFVEEEFLHKRIQKEDVSFNSIATMNIPEDAVKQYGSMVALRWWKSFMFTLSILRECLHDCCRECWF